MNNHYRFMKEFEIIYYNLSLRDEVMAIQKTNGYLQLILSQFFNYIINLILFLIMI